MLLPSWNERRRMFIAESWVFVSASYLAVLIGLTFPQHWRATGEFYVACATGACLIRTFLFHLGFILALIALVSAFSKKWRLFTFTLPLLIVCQGPALLSYLPKASPPPEGEVVTIMSVNLLGCNQDTDGILAEVRAFQPDVLALQEYRPHWHAVFQEALLDEYPYFCCETRTDDFGQALYSRYPFAQPADMELPLGDAGTPQTRVVVDFDGRRAAVYNVHFMPPKSVEYARRQRVEFADLLDKLALEELPVIVCGDFNFTNESPFADDLSRQGLVDVHRLCGRGRGATWPVLYFYRYLPGLRLDHIFLNGAFRGVDCDTGIGRGSDHRPLCARVAFQGG